jgi:hypothetical protein
MTRFLAAKVSFLLAAAGLVLVACVPPSYQPLYNELQSRLDATQLKYGNAPASNKAPALVLELLTANGNRGEDLLGPNTVAATRLFLDRFKEMGATGVSVQIVYPLLAKNYPQSAEYLAFYRSVAAEVRKRGMTLIIETGAPFAGTEFSSLHVDYTGKTPRAYLQERLEQAKTIAQELRPDYLCLAEEQMTERDLTGLNITTDDYFSFLSSARSFIRPPAGVKIGAGSGSWENPDLVQRLIHNTSLDFIDIHVYPLSNGPTDYLQVTHDWASEAVAAGKQAVIGEAWLYKVSVQELQAGVGFQQLFGRDVYSFWAPLDEEFMQVMVDLGKSAGITYISFFWDRYFFAYLDYNTVPAGTTGAVLQQLANQASSAAFLRGELTSTGKEFQRLASGAP